ncbi:MAG: hypothetical protein AVDCRST_MAG87-1767, partial [uncultured Thermomicrobiales bacterium]
ERRCTNRYCAEGPGNSGGTVGAQDQFPADHRIDLACNLLCRDRNRNRVAGNAYLVDCRTGVGLAFMADRDQHAVT